ncbi:SusC/RagA family TonB-linked outer membrane protein [Formosa sp. 3Alg 14/1]|uniref:SusC/RagA family TonB-linked outer membrane protein n=1 Tax=Formosa sp. 3Alg 14/1 TaxID=3382190 RepID=UPI0039BDE664
MKTFIFFFSMSLFSLTPKNGFSQGAKIEIESSRVVSVDEVFELIKNQTDYTFIYRADLFENYPKVTLKKGTVKAQVLLEKTLSNGSFSYEFAQENTIIIKSKISEDDLGAKVDNDDEVQSIINGVVVDENGVPLPGVTILLKGTRKGTTTDFDGNFKINLTGNTETPILVFTFIGYEKQEVNVGTKTSITVKMKPELSGLDEVVVIGYGTSTVRDATGVIARIQSEDIENAPMATTVESLIQGKASGVNVQIQSASPTSPVSVVIRGMSSLDGDNQPLWVIDGVPQESTVNRPNYDPVTPLADLNLEEIESIDILKDASATAVYGSRAAHGVIIITSKKGKRNTKPVFQFSTNISQSITDYNAFEYFDGPQYESFMEAAYREQIITNGWTGDSDQFFDEQAFFNLNTSEYDASDLTLLPTAFYGGDTDWQEEVSQNPFNVKHDLSVSGGSELTTFYVALGIIENDGVVKSGYNNGYNGSVRLDTRLSDRLTFGINLRGSTRDASNKDGLLTVVNRIRPDLKPYNEDGSLYYSYYVENPFTAILNENSSKTNSLNTTAYLEYEVIKGLRWRSSFTNAYADSEYLSFNYAGTYQTELSERRWRSSKRNRDLFDNTLTFAKLIGDKHDITALLGYSLEKYSTSSYSIYAEDFADDDLLNNFGSHASVPIVSESKGESALIGQFARVHYKYDDRYIISGTIRRDGSSRFGSDRQWGTFPSGALAWIVSEENFMNSNNMKKYLSYLKLRTSIGITGSTGGLGYSDWATGIQAETYNDSPAISPSSLGNPHLQWEETTMFDLGLDFSILNDRVSGSVGIYKKHSDKLIYDNDIPWSSSERYTSANIAAMKANGVEVSLRADIFRTKNDRLTFNFNWATNKSTVEKITGNLDQLIFYSYDTRMILNVGDEIGDWYGYQTAGRFYATAEDSYSFRNSLDEYGNQEPYVSETEGKGDMIYVDQNGDGIITADDDRVSLGSSIPDGYGGFGLNYTHKNFNISANFSYAYGHLRHWTAARDWVRYGMRDYNSSVNLAGESSVVLSPEEASFPRVLGTSIGGNGQFSDFFLHDASYLRLNALAMSYNLPREIFRNTVLKSLTLNFRASNLFTITDYPGFRPDGGSILSSVGTASAEDSSTYPDASVYSLGLIVKF